MSLTGKQTTELVQQRDDLRDDLTDREKIRNFFSFLMVESSSCIESALKILNSVRNRISEEEHRNTYSRVEKANAMIAYSIWETFNINKSPRSIDEIAQVCGCSSNAILKLENALELNHTHCTTSDYVSRIGESLEFPFWFQSLLKKILEHTNFFAQYKPVNLIAAIIIRSCRLILSWEEEQKTEKLAEYKTKLLDLYNASKKKFEFEPARWTVPEVCMQLGTSSGVIYRLMRQIDNDFIEERLEEIMS